MKYIVIDVPGIAYDRVEISCFDLIDEYGNRTYWTIKHNEQPWTSYELNVYGKGSVSGGCGAWIVPIVIELNIDNPQESIERIKKLCLLK